MLRFHSNGKLLISGEYFILLGAKALAVPVKYGQSLEINRGNGYDALNWESYILNKFWFRVVYGSCNLDIRDTTDLTLARKLTRILNAAKDLNPGFLSGGDTFSVRANVNFNISWGLGSSSSLISNIAYWSGTDPFQLLKMVSSGSGYDIACARTDSPIIYQLHRDQPIINRVIFNPPFSNKLYFIYLGRKEDSEENLKNHIGKCRQNPNWIDFFSDFTDKIATAGNIDEFNEYIREHERQLSAILGVETIKGQRFRDYNGEMKSLGAWGGDFALATWEGSREDLLEYFRRKGLFTLFPFKDIILKSQS
ncbi:MAG: hypothetical protein JSV24_05475 [Bacteroidales bacterium]|nr:MAG: hypothetical protein JSV24_05475 [Bacteroidales bacterium]